MMRSVLVKGAESESPYGAIEIVGSALTTITIQVSYGKPVASGFYGDIVLWVISKPSLFEQLLLHSIDLKGWILKDEAQVIWTARWGSK
jgi:hypothetical protein